MFTRLNKIYHEFPRLFWVVVVVSFIDRIGGTLLFPFFALYITQKFSVGMTQAGILLGVSSLFGLIGSTIGGALTDKFGRKQLILFGLVFSAVVAVDIDALDSLLDVALGHYQQFEPSVGQKAELVKRYNVARICNRDCQYAVLNRNRHRLQPSSGRLRD